MYPRSPASLALKLGAWRMYTCTTFGISRDPRPKRGNIMYIPLSQEAKWRSHLARKARCAINPPMMKVLEIAIEKLKALPEDKQAYAAEVIEHIAASDDGVFQIPDAHRAGVMEGLAQADKGEFATDDQMDALWKQCGL